MNPLLELIAYGQSYWLDNLTRAMIANGALKRRVEEQGLRGVTSNPAIFHKAISGSDDYEAQIVQLVRERRPIQDIYEQLVVTDVQAACDILRPVYEASDGLDGFVSLEVSPYLAHDTAGTMHEARRLFKAVARPNVFIKIPGTSAGVPAIEAMLYEGININVTLLFSIQSYDAVAQAYVRALERRVADGLPVQNVASVASFFLSRIDVLVDQLLGHRLQPARNQGDGLRPEQLMGKVAIASAKLAYQRFLTLFHGCRWQALAAKGARVQRPLWASTSTKNPLYSDVCYVEPLIGPHTVNTMPDETIDAFADHGVISENSVEADVEDAQQVMRDLAGVGIDLAMVTQQLLHEGIQKFIDPFDMLMRTLASKRQMLLGETTGSQTIACGALQATVQGAAAALDRRQFTRRLWGHDPHLWTAATSQVDAIRQRLGWLDSFKTFRDRVDDLTAFAARVQEAGFRHVVLLGMGGSSLCAEVCHATFGTAPGWPELVMLDNTDPAAVQAVDARIDLARTLFVIASKSGTTSETVSFYRYFFQRVTQTGVEKPGAQFIAITDPGSPLVEEAHRQGFRRCFENPADIGGRYSALSYFGLVPMALLGIDIATLLERAHQMAVSSGPVIPADTNTGVSLGTLLGMAARHGRDKVTFVPSASISAFGYWVEQLLAESTGKEGKGLVPVEGEPLGTPAVYGQDRLFVSIRTAAEVDAEHQAKLAALETAGHPIVRIVLGDTLALGGEFLRWELATATAGAVLKLNPFDEPNVAESKNNTRHLLQEWRQLGSFREEQPAVQEQGMAIYGDQGQPWFPHGPQTIAAFLQAFVDLSVAPDYLALLAYFQPTAARHEILQRLRLRWRDRRRVATTLGYGPRYLHSTGQLHKGGPNRGVYILLTAEAADECPIPGQPYGFATLQRAQALGDFRSLLTKQCRVIRLHLGRDLEAGLTKLLAWLGS